MTKAEVVVVGGGLTGALTAYAFAASGAKVVLLEADRVGRGMTARSSGVIAEDPGISFADLEKQIGLRGARRAWQAWRRAALDFTSLLRRLDVKCHLEEPGSVTLASTPEQAARLKKEQKARTDAGFDARSKKGATIDPYRACLGIIAAAVDRGAQIFEQSPVRKLSFTRKTIDVYTAAGPIRTDRVVIATGMPGTLFKALARHFWFHSTYFAVTEPVPAKIRNVLGMKRAIVRDLATPPHTLHWVRDNRLLVSGADSPVVIPRLRDKVIVQRTGQLMYELSTMYPDISGIQPSYGWSADYARTEDGLPYIGVHRNYPFHLFAFGDSSHSVTGSYLASRILLRHYSGEMDPADEAFGFHR